MCAPNEICVHGMESLNTCHGICVYAILSALDCHSFHSQAFIPKLSVSKFCFCLHQSSTAVITETVDLLLELDEPPNDLCQQFLEK